MEQAIAAGAGVVVYEHAWPSGGIHHHRVRILRVDFPQWNTSGYYTEVSEPGACGCVSRVELGTLVHALMNMTDGEVRAVEDRETCGTCGHNHHLDDPGAER